MNIRKQRNVVKRLHCGTHRDMLQLLLSVGEEAAGVEGLRGKDEWD